jgi:hypothetical protein
VVSRAHTNDRLFHRYDRQGGKGGQREGGRVIELDLLCICLASMNQCIVRPRAVRQDVSRDTDGCTVFNRLKPTLSASPLNSSSTLDLCPKQIGVSQACGHSPGYLSVHGNRFQVILSVKLPVTGMQGE